MPNPSGHDDQPDAPAAPDGTADAPDALAAALSEAGIDAPSVDPASLAAGLLVGLERPDRARRLLVLLAGRSTSGRTAATPEPAGEPADEPATGQPDRAAADGEVPVGSMLLARAASMAMESDPPLNAETTFGWAARLTRDQVLSMGRVVGDMLAAGGPRDLERGFAITWSGGVRLPSSDFTAQFKAFTELEVTVASVLAGANLRATVHVPEEGRFASLFGSLLAKSDPLSAESAAVLERGGETAKRGLIALWNTWMAMCYRSSLPTALFDQLVQPWITVVGPLPDA